MTSTIPARALVRTPPPAADPRLLYSILREPRPEFHERRAQPPRLELGHALHQLLEVLFCDVLEVVEVAGDVEDRFSELRGPVVLDPFEQALLQQPHLHRVPGGLQVLKGARRRDV